MLNDIVSPAVGVVKEIKVSGNEQQVQESELLVVIQGYPAEGDDDDDDDEEAAVISRNSGGGGGGDGAAGNYYIAESYGTPEATAPTTGKFKTKVKKEEKFKARTDLTLTLTLGQEGREVQGPNGTSREARQGA